MDKTDEDLKALAVEALKTAWSPYSGFSVGAALLAEDGEVFTGANVENASYGLTVCAERVAVFKAVTAGHRSFRKLALVCDGDHPVTPCGACLQVLREFAVDLPIVYGNVPGSFRTTSLKKLLPDAFAPEDLGTKGA